MVDHVSVEGAGEQEGSDASQAPSASEQMYAQFGSEFTGLAQKSQELKEKLEEKINEMIQFMRSVTKGKPDSKVAPFAAALKSAQTQLADGVNPETVQKDLKDVTSIGKEGVPLMSSLVLFRGQVQESVDRIKHGEPISKEHSKVLSALEGFEEIAHKYLESDDTKVKEAAENFVNLAKNAYDEMSESGDFSHDALSSLGIDF